MNHNFNTSCTGLVKIQDPTSAITVPADVLAPNSARTSAGTMLTTKLNIFSSKFLWLSIFFHHLSGPNDIIQNDRWYLLTFRLLKKEIFVWSFDELFQYYFLSRELDAMSGQWFYSKFRESKRNRKTKKVITGPDLVRTSIRRRGFCKSTICYFFDEISDYLCYVWFIMKRNLYFHEGICITLLGDFEDRDIKYNV